MVDNTGRFFLKPEQICNYYHYSNLCILIMVHQRYNFTVRKIRAAKDRERDRLLEIPLEFHREQTSRYTLRLGEIPQPYEKKKITSVKQSLANICFLMICELFHSLGKSGKKCHQSLAKLSSAGVHLCNINTKRYF